jgi:hypothetical protein
MRLPSEKLVLDRATPSDVALRASTVGYLAFLAFAWGGNYAWTKLALADSEPWAFNALRYLCASIVLGAILLARGRESRFCRFVGSVCRSRSSASSRSRS